MDPERKAKTPQPIQKLAGQTMIYGLSTVIPRVINYLLVIYHTRLFSKAEYGVVTELYAYVTFLVVLLTYGMETGFFRFSQQKEQKDTVYGTAFLSLLFTSLLFVAGIVLFHGPVASWMDYAANPEYILWFGLILGMDALTAIPFARLRLNNQPLRFSAYKLINVLTNVGFTFFFYAFCPAFADNVLIEKIYNPEIGVGYVFVSNLIASIVVLILLLPEMFRFRIRFSSSILRELLIYSLPLMVAGLAGSINEAIDRVMLKDLLKPEDLPMEQLGVYGANFKMAILMVLFIQMFRYASEPFFFSNSKEADSRKTIAEVMKFFVISGLVIFLGVTLYLDLFRYLIDEKFWGGLGVVPILLFAYLGLGIYYNLTIGFKLSNKTHVGIIIAFTGAAVSIAGNLLFVPEFSYFASAWTHLVCYVVMCVLAQQITQKIYPIPYAWKQMFVYVLLALAIFVVAEITRVPHLVLNLAKNTLLIGIFIVFALRKEQIVSRYRNGEL